MKYFAFLLCLAFAIPVLAETDYIAMPEIRKLKNRADSLEDRVTATEAVTANGVSATNVIIAANGKTNTITVTKGVITSWVVVP